MLERLSADDVKFLVLAALHYSKTGESPAEIPQSVAPTYALLQEQADIDTAKYEEKRESNRQAGLISAERRTQQRELTVANTNKEEARGGEAKSKYKSWNTG
jgi:cbb3-type cytochrome oxidase cytochrome c subunit